MIGKVVEDVGKIGIARGLTKTIAYPGVGKKANELMKHWVLASSQESVPRDVANECKKTDHNQRQITGNTNLKIDNADDNITEWEIENVVQRGKPTSPGSDGVTYNIISALTEVKSYPLCFI